MGHGEHSGGSAPPEKQHDAKAARPPWWVRAPHPTAGLVLSLAMASIALLFVPLDLGAARRGRMVRRQSGSPAGQLLEQLGHDVVDLGDVTVPTAKTLRFDQGIDYLPTITSSAVTWPICTAACSRGRIPLVLGGDHSLGAGSVAASRLALAERNQRVGLIWLYAHAT